MIYYKNSSELYHHGILGQKWGVRRYQNTDGTLTDAGKKRYDEVGSSRRLSKKMTRGAVRSLSRQSNFNSEMSDRAHKSALRKSNKANQNRERAEKYAKKAEKYNNYAKKMDTEANRKMKESTQYGLEAKQLEQKVREISLGQKKAGRDFIFERGLADTSFNVVDYDARATYIEAPYVKK